ncbi:peptidoglycan-associated lipoprotein Pal [Profundibacterium mesophilum]|uniref:Peptidoglycan-associated lipoprotein n=1 Tax=Profundibacterium mesophilum KAUST100406-0324 TaxID=1037889 RepID=A0A921NUY8_9RHOB|nr:peptidoglycan-associated lipoprotein Pal [Profundibacterium mesophilum]KAF0675746.1 Outer membrane lipoprotein Omp16 like protein [Profundibacterium mesophilum KAUST100406-0324]
MKILGKATLLSVMLLAAACTNADRFGTGAGAGMDGGMGAGLNGGFGDGVPLGNGGAITQGTLDPASPAYFEQTIGDRVLFEVDQSTVSPSGRATLDAQAGWLSANPSYTAIIEGHADEQGTREYNLALGARRAASARDYLVSQGVSSGRLRTVTYGKERPIEVCSTEQCYAKNRRAVTVVAAGLSS